MLADDKLGRVDCHLYNAINDKEDLASVGIPFKATHICVIARRFSRLGSPDWDEYHSSSDKLLLSKDLLVLELGTNNHLWAKHVRWPCDSCMSELSSDALTSCDLIVVREFVDNSH